MEVFYGGADRTLFKPHMLDTILADLTKAWHGLTTEKPPELPAKAYNVTYEL